MFFSFMFENIIIDGLHDVTQYKFKCLPIIGVDCLGTSMIMGYSLSTEDNETMEKIAQLFNLNLISENNYFVTFGIYVQ